MYKLITATLLILLTGCNINPGNNSDQNNVNMEDSYGYNRDFLKKYTDIIELSDGDSRIVIVPGWQARVMTSTSGGNNGFSYGWINHSLIESGKLLDHINPFGGEERFWLGPEGGQYSLFFKEGDPFDFDHWQTPALLDTEKFDISGKTDSSAVFTRRSKLINYSGTTFDIIITRKIRLLRSEDIYGFIKTDLKGLKFVAYKSENILENSGDRGWNREEGLLSIWMLGMFNPSPSAIVIIPVNPGSSDDLGPEVNDNYFGKISHKRLIVRNNLILFKADGLSRGKIGISPLRSKGYMGSYDPENSTLTLLFCDIPQGVTEFINSSWELQENPYSGDALNSYNDGPVEDGSIMGPFYELETSSPALALSPGERYNHTQTTFHITGPEEKLDKISRELFGINLKETGGWR